MNIEDYKPDDVYTSLSNELVFEPRDSPTNMDILLMNKLKGKIIKNIRTRRNFFLFLQSIYLNCYLFTKSIEISPFINSNDHNTVTNYSYAYDFSVIMFITYTLNTISHIHDTNVLVSNPLYKNRTYVFIYCLVTILSGIGFALLGEVPFLKVFTISGDFWKHLSLKELVVFCLIGVPIVLLTTRELLIMIRNRTMRRLFFVYSLILGLFALNLFCLKLYNAENIHYHVHHAIFAGVMSVIFSKWNGIWNILMHAIYMGVLIEGISFYGLQELYIFMCDNSHIVNYSISFVFSFVSLFLWIVLGLIFYPRLYI